MFKIDDEESESMSHRKVFKVDSEEDLDSSILSEIMSVGAKSDRLKMRSLNSSFESGDEKVKKKMPTLLF